MDDMAWATDDDPAERVVISVTSGSMAGETLDFWQSCQIDRSLDDCASLASVAVGRGKLVESGYERFPLAPGDGVMVKIGENPVINGWVSKRNTTRSAEQHGLNVQIRSVTCDLVDCSAVNSPGQWVGAKISRIAADLTRGFGVPVKVSPDYDRVVPNFEIEQGESVFDALERLAHAAGMIVHDTAFGVLVLTRPAMVSALTVLLHLNGGNGGADPRNNVLESNGEVDESKRFSSYTVKGQGEGGKAAAAAKGTAIDQGVVRHRPKIISAPSKATNADCLRLAQWEMVRRSGQAEKLIHGVKGWRQKPGGDLWDIDILAEVQDDDAEIYGKRLITAVSWQMGQKGRLARLTMQPPEAWLPKPFMDKHTSGGGAKWASVAAAVKKG